MKATSKKPAQQQKSWTQLADMKVGQLILEGGDRTWPELLRRIRRLDKTGQDVIQGTRK